MSGRRLRAVGALIALFTFSGVLAAGVAVAGQPAGTTAASADRPCDVETPPVNPYIGFQPLKLCASFDKSSYRSSDIVKLTVSVTNLGTGPASGLYLTLPYNGTISFKNWLGYDPTSLFGQTNGRVLEPGDTITSELNGYAADPASGVVRFTDAVYQGGPTGGQAYGSGVDISAPVTQVTADYGGTVTTFPGAGLAGVAISMSGPFDGIDGAGPKIRSATTDAQGRFDFSGLPGGVYLINLSGPDNWVVEQPASGMVTVDGSPGSTAVNFPATRPLSETLHATMAFDQASYAVGDEAHLTITLSNVGQTVIGGIKAHCDLGETRDVLSGNTPGWGALAGGGVTVEAGQTVTLHVSQVVPVTDLPDGTVRADCAFGPSTDWAGYPEPSATARVTAPAGPTTSFHVHLVTDPALGTPSAYVDIDLPATHDPIDTNYAAPDCLLTGIPDGSYELAISGGWHLAPGQSTVLNTADIPAGGTVDVHVLPGSATTPPPTSTTTPPPTTTTTTSAPGTTSPAPAGTTPAGTASGGGGNLPFTGVDLVWPALAALVLILAGGGALLLIRRRRTAG